MTGTGTGPTWRCSACDTYNAAAERACEICGTAKGAAVGKPSAAPAKSVPTPVSKPEPKSVPKPVSTSAPKSSAKPPAKLVPKPAAAKRRTTPKRAGASGSSAKRPGPAKTTPAKSTSPKSTSSRSASAKPPAKPAGSGVRDAKSADPTWELARLLEGKLPAETLFEGADGKLRTLPELAVLMPEIFNPDGTFKTPGSYGGLAGSGSWLGPTGDLARDAVLAETPWLKRAADPEPAVTPKPGPAPTVGQEAFACGCLLIIAAAVVYGIVMLVMHWGAVAGFFMRDHGSGKASPSPTVTASGPCPAALDAKLPKKEAAGARPVAVYNRPDITEGYAFCRTTAGNVYFFQREGGVSSSAPFGNPLLATPVKGGYEVGSDTSTLDVFTSGTLRHYVKGKEKWHAPYNTATSV